MLSFLQLVFSPNIATSGLSLSYIFYYTMHLKAPFLPLQIFCCSLTVLLELLANDAKHFMAQKEQVSSGS